MSGKFERKTVKKKKSPIAVILLVVAIVAALAVAAMLFLLPGDQEAVSGMTEAAQNPTEQAQAMPTDLASALPMTLDGGLKITRIASYAGLYLEDGSDEPVSNILMIMVENTSEEDLQYARVKLQYADAEATFAVSNLPAGAQAVLLEESRMAFTDAVPQSAATENMVHVAKFSMYEDIFRITGMDGALNVKNISENDITGDVFVYYKNYIADTYYGGITYRVRIEGGLKAGEIRQIMTQHYDAEGSDILMVTYTN